MRLTPKSVFLGIVLLGFPFAIALGWSLGHQEAPPAIVSAEPGGAGGIGAAPVRVTHPTAEATTSPRSVSEPVSVIEPVATSVAPSALPSAPAPATSETTSPAPTLTEPPVPTPTSVAPSEPSGSPSPSESSEPAPSWLGGLFLRR
ncbi:hypothetical protein [Winogradskya humida]|uniref:Uncharacterized protein n=1 Tax=Winogradskya humida TaxID=113566 RepID=A0ABQ3ZQV1_9ACTN|nr:hypothetical protein [Actinoplanes humidus]GIE20952.1 hypothetical protein Ahu01nite_040540 [Actinoplanes humidus]